MATVGVKGLTVSTWKLHLHIIFIYIKITHIKTPGLTVILHPRLYVQAAPLSI